MSNPENYLEGDGPEGESKLQTLNDPFRMGMCLRCINAGSGKCIKCYEGNKFKEVSPNA